MSMETMSGLTTVVVVAYGTGRIGSSAIMGLLQRAGSNVGANDRLPGPAAMNPKGFFELPSQSRLLARIYDGYYPDVAAPPPIELLDEIGRRHYQEYQRLLDDEFGSAPLIAVKSQRFLTLPLLNELRQSYEVRVLSMDRVLDDQIDSTLRVWQNCGEPAKMKATRDFIAEWILAWRGFAEQVQHRYEFEYLNVSFDDLIRDPRASARRIARFVGIACPPDPDITEWIDASLVNRRVLTL